MNNLIKHGKNLEQRVKQLEDVINKVFAFRISTSFAENVNALTILQNELQKALEGKDER